MNNLINQVEQWSIDKGLDKSNSFAQFTKTVEETGEVASGLARGDKALIEDGIGDVIVTLIILAQQQGMSLEQCLQTAYNEISGRTGEMIDGVFVKSSDLK